MAESATQPEVATPDDAAGIGPQLEQSTYDVLHARLQQQAQHLRERLDKLNARRKEVFGSIETELVGTDRITTPHNCVPRDMVAVGNRLLFGYNVRFGLKTEIDLSDVFALYRFDGETFHEVPLDTIRSPEFEKDFRDLYRFYKHTTFAKFFHKGPNLYLKFRVGRDVDDFKAFKFATEAADVNPRLAYLDNRSDHEVRYPRQQEFDWTPATREMHRPGKHPHIAIDDTLFVETIGGDLTIKVEDNTETGRGIYSEPVDHRDQTLDDAEIAYVRHGHLYLLRIRPYQEKAFRYFVFNTKLQQVIRQDALGAACVLLPEDHGLAFPNGYYLATGEHQTFPNIPTDMVFERRIAAPNGEDHLFIFYARVPGLYALLSYNVIEQSVETPTLCHGFSLFPDGKLVQFKLPPDEQPQKHHAIQVWRTPYLDADRVDDAVPEEKRQSHLYKVGNRDVVRGMAECQEVLKLIRREDRYADLYLDIARTTADLLDTYHWLDHEEAEQLGEVLRSIREAAQAAVAEFEKVTQIKRTTAEQTQRVADDTRDRIRENHARLYESIDEYVASLGGLRTLRGRIIGLRELRYHDAERINALEAEVEEQSDDISLKAVAFLLRDDALDPYLERVEQQAAAVPELEKFTDAKELQQRVDASANELEMLITIVGNLEIEDATQRTAIIDAISAVFSKLNAVRSRLKNRRDDLARREGTAEFSSQLKLLNQAVVNYLDLADTPDKVDEHLTRLMVQVEELEGRFAEFDEFVEQLTQKRQEIFNAFESRKLQLIERRQQRAQSLGQAAERILTGVKSRVSGLKDIEAILAVFASDLMIDKVRDLVKQLEELGDTVRAGEVQTQLKTIREDAVRQLKDRQELNVAGENAIRLGRHVFAINTQPIDLTTVLRNDRLHLHISGTQFFQPITHPALEGTQPVWDQEVVSESDEVYRAEYLAYEILEASRDVPSRPPDDRGDTPRLAELAAASDKELLTAVQRFMGPRYREGYTKGVHDHDAAKLLRALVDMQTSIGLLRYSPRARALAVLAWRLHQDPADREALAGRIAGFGTIARRYPDTAKQQRYTGELRRRLVVANDSHEALAALFISDPEDADVLLDAAADYLFRELSDEHDRFIASPDAAELVERFLRDSGRHEFARTVESVDGLLAKYLLIHDWLAAYANPTTELVDEAAAILLDGGIDHRRVIDAQTRRDINGLLGSHPRIDDSRLTLDYHDFTARLGRFTRHRVPLFERYQQAKREVVEQARMAMEVEELRAKVMSAFVRNRLIDRVYLPLIGNNFAKQLGTAGEDTRTDRQGLLLLISPPGYGKTTLMEYVGSRLGIAFVKINGPSLGHDTTSLDPAAAPTATAREEIDKLNLALEMGDNTLIYLDDIQHCSPELLQKFIPLCDATRRIEGVWNGKAKTYDLRGRKVAVVMAGNPYTESGERFRIPDMLANRADTYNLGDILGEHAEAFELSYIENALTSNPTLAPLATRAREDVYSVVQITEEGSREGLELKGNWSPAEVDEMVRVMQHLLRVRDVVMTVNRAYIRSAAMEDQYRTEPPFQLQGSYRNMNRIAERVVPVMNEEELTELIVSSYEQDAQTLTTGAEANLLRFRELIGIMTDSERERWEAIMKTFRRNNTVASLGGDDKTAQVLAQLADFNQGLGSIREAVSSGVERLSEGRNGEEAEGRAVLREAVREGLERLAEVVAQGGGTRAEARSAAPPPEPVNGPPYEIRVTNKVPDTFLYIIKEQFELMKHWLEPLTRITAHQDSQLEHLATSMQQIADRYDRLIDRLEATRPEKVAEHAEAQRRGG